MTAAQLFTLGLILVGIGAALLRYLGWPLARLVVIPLGWVRGAHELGILSRAFTSDPVGGALFLGAWAYQRHRRPEDRAWLDTKLAAAMPLGGGGIAATGLLAAAGGDLAQARAWLTSLDWVHPKVLPPVCRRLAREWLAAEAASRGAWAEVVAHASVSPTRAARFLAAVARQLTHGSAENVRVSRGQRLRLWLLWLAAPRRRATHPLLVQALTVAPLPAPPPTAEAEDPHGPYRSPAPPSLDLLQRALAAHAQAILAPTQDTLLDAVSAWDQAAAGLSTEMREGALADLAAVATSRRFSVPDGRGFAEDLRREVRRDLLDELETVSRALESRVAAGRVHDAFAEWSTFLQLRRMYDEAGTLAGREAQRLVYARVHDALCPLAVVLWNQRKELPLANAMFRWLLDQARLTDHATLIPHEEKNVACRF